MFEVAKLVLGAQDNIGVCSKIGKCRKVSETLPAHINVFYMFESAKHLCLHSVTPQQFQYLNFRAHRSKRHCLREPFI